MFKHVIALCAALLLSQNVQAGPRHGVYTPGSAAAGFFQLGLGDVQGPAYAFLDQFKTLAYYAGTSYTSVSNGPDFPKNLDVNQLPTIANPLPNSIAFNFETPQGGTGWLTYQMSWTGGAVGDSPVTIQAGVTGLSVTSNGVNCPSCIITNTGSQTTVRGQNIVATFTFTSVHASTLNGLFSSGASYPSFANFRFCQSGNATPDDCTRLANGEILNPVYVGAIKGLPPKTIRTMDWSGANQGSLTQFKYRNPLSAVGWIQLFFQPNLWAGNITNVGDVYTSPTFTDAPASWPTSSSSAPYLLWLGYVNSANTTTTPTMQITGITGVKTIVGADSADSISTPISIGEIVVNRPAVFVYDPVIDKVLYYGLGGITSSVPIEARIALANAINANLWTTLPFLIDDASVIQYANLIRSTLNPALYSYVEYDNEVWNGTFDQTHIATAHGIALGFPNNNGEPYHGWYSLRANQIMRGITSAWGGQGNLRRVIGVNAIAAFVTQYKQYRLEGADLNEDTYPNYCAYIGGVYTISTCSVHLGYNASPNRLVDVNDVLAYATYYQGAVLAGPGNYTGTYAAGDLAACSVAGTNSGGLGCAIANYALGTASAIDAAFKWIDGDIRNGTKNGATASSTLSSFANPTLTNSSGTMIGIESEAACYDGNGTVITSGSFTFTCTGAGRNQAGLAALRIENYEGAPQFTWPTASDCTNTGLATVLGVSAATCSTMAQAMVQGYTASSYSQQLSLDQFQQVIGTFANCNTATCQYQLNGLLSHHKTPSWFDFQGWSSPVQNIPWNMLLGSIYVGAPTYTPAYQGAKSFVGVQN